VQRGTPKESQRGAGASRDTPYVEIDAYSNGQFSPSLYDDPADGLGIIGTDFTLEKGHGYALYTDRAGSLTFSSSGVS
jgi:hypothetical protein